MWESEKLFFVVKRASLPRSSLHIHDLRAPGNNKRNNLLNNESGLKCYLHNYVTNQ